MTTEELIDRVQNFKIFKQDKISFNPDEIYTPANDAQNFLLTSLRMVEGKGYLGLAAGQETYQFSTKTISDASNASPIVITTSANHLYNTGDTVIIDGVLGNTAANGTFQVTRISATTFSLDGSTGNAAYTSGGYSYHTLQRAFEVFQAKKTGLYYGYLIKKDIDVIEQDREQFGSTCAPDEVQRYYESFQEEYLFGTQGVTNAAMTLQLSYYRLPLSFERIANGVNPILPAIADRALYYGTVKYLLEDMDQDGKQEIIRRYLAEADNFFNNEISRIASVNAERKRPRIKAHSRLRW